MKRLAIFVAFGGLATGGPLEAQLSARIAEMDEVDARFGYAARPGVEICDQGIRIGERRVWWRSENGQRERSRCRIGRVEVAVEVRRGTVTALELVRDREPWGGSSGRDEIDLGEVAPGEAARFLLSLARADVPHGVAEDAILPAVLADTESLWPELIGLARDVQVRAAVRKRAIFWVGQEAAEVVTEELSDVALSDSEDQEVRNAAIFALSQRPAEESVPALIEIASVGREPETRKTAMFWLARSDDPRVLEFFEDVLLGRSD